MNGINAKIKELLDKIPQPLCFNKRKYGAYLRKLHGLIAESIDLQTKTHKLASENKELHAKTYELIAENKRLLDKMPQKIYSPKKSYETYLRIKFLDEMASLNLRADYPALLSGLDSVSISTVSSVLSKMRRLRDTDRPELELFSEEEQQQIKLLEKNFWPNILRLDSGCFAYQSYLLPIKHFEPSVFYYQHEMHYLTTLDGIGNKAIIDVGGFIGDSALVFAKRFGGKVYSFEPMRGNYQNMLKTIALNKITNIVPVNMGIADTDRTAAFYVDGAVSSEHEGQFVKEVSETAKMIPLDEYVAEHNLEVGLIKVDTEGAEQDVLKGAERTIKTQRPILILSIYHSAYDFFQIKPLVESWNLGYSFKIRRPTDGQILAETVLLAEVE